jgi:hypothetical protein
MNPKLKLLLILAAALATTAAGSHGLVHWLRIRTGGIGYNFWSERDGKRTALVEGSSLMLEGLSWKRISMRIGTGIENWFVAGSSPSEWEVLQKRSPKANQTFIAISAYDLNENFLCDSRSEVVPLDQTIKDLWQSHADWHFSKRVLSQYPVRYARLFFPTIGRSDGVMVGFRERLAELLKPWATINSEAGPSIASGNESGIEHFTTDKVTDWPRSRTLRRLALMRNACGGRHSFDGPKKLALLRMLQQAQNQGHVIVIVLPVSTIYAREFLTAEVLDQFEGAISEAQRAVPEAEWIRLDRLPSLNSDEYFWDFVHLNANGQRIATGAFLAQCANLMLVSAQ